MKASACASRSFSGPSRSPGPQRRRTTNGRLRRNALLRAGHGPADGKVTASELTVATLAVSLGGVETLICFPKETSHAKLSEEQRRQGGISDTLVRVSVGIEDIDDLQADFDQALKDA